MRKLSTHQSLLSMALLCIGVSVCACVLTLLLVGVNVAPRLIALRPQVPRVIPEALLLDIAAFPGGWSYGVRMSEREANRFFAGQYDAAAQWYEAESEGEKRQGSAIHFVGRYSSEWLAHRNYQELASDYFRSSDRATTQWAEPPGWDYSPRSNEFRVGCAVESGAQGTVERCRMVARYGKYVSMFWLEKGLGSTAQADLESIARSIDATFSKVENSR